MIRHHFEIKIASVNLVRIVSFQLLHRMHERQTVAQLNHSVNTEQKQNETLTLYCCLLYLPVEWGSAKEEWNPVRLKSMLH